MGDIREHFQTDDAMDIFGNKETAIEFLIRRGERVKASEKAGRVYELVVENWEYEEALPIVRQMFRETDKYRQGNSGSKLLPELINEWKSMGLGDVAWPCGQAAFDKLVQRINTSNASRATKDEEVNKASLKFRRMKELVTVRNDLIEALLFEANEEIIPTLKHTAGTDFFVRGDRFDQKTSKSVGKAFKEEFGDQWREEAISRPQAVARSLYENQDPDRFSDGPRLYVVDVDETAFFDPAAIRAAVDQAEVGSPVRVDFKYDDRGGGKVAYSTRCITVLLVDPAL